jgi:hypothetical protein
MINLPSEGDSAMIRRSPHWLHIAILMLTVQSNAQGLPAQLRQSSEYWYGEKRPVRIRWSPLSDHRKIAVAGDTIYMLDTKNRNLWSWSSYGPPLIGNPIVDSRGILYAIGLDLLWVAIDANRGEEKWRGTANGKATYSQIALYDNDKYLVVTNMDEYRRESPRTRDILTLCRGNDILWEIDIPPNTRMHVRDRYVLMIRPKTGSIEQKTRIPREFGNPIGKVSIEAQ